jgi:hypothetical protein
MMVLDAEAFGCIPLAAQFRRGPSVLDMAPLPSRSGKRRDDVVLRPVGEAFASGER